MLTWQDMSLSLERRRKLGIYELGQTNRYLNTPNMNKYVSEQKSKKIKNLVGNDFPTQSFWHSLPNYVNVRKSVTLSAHCHRSGVWHAYGEVVTSGTDNLV